MPPPRIRTVIPSKAIEGGRVTIDGSGFTVDATTLPEIYVGDVRARIVFASSSRLDVIVPTGLESGSADAQRRLPLLQPGTRRGRVVRHRRRPSEVTLRPRGQEAVGSRSGA